MGRFDKGAMIVALFFMMLTLQSCGLDERTTQENGKNTIIQFSAPTSLIQRILENEMFDWQMVETQPFKIYFLPGTYSENNLEFLKTGSEEAIARALEVLKEKEFPHGLRLFMVETRDQMEELTGLNVKGYAPIGHDAVLLVYNPEIRPYLRHEIFHAVSIKLWGAPDIWLREGSAAFADGECLDYSLDEIALYLLETNQTVTLHELIDDFWGTNDMITYIQSASLFQYLYHNYSITQVKSLWQKGSKSIPANLGVSQDQLEENWKSDMRTLKLDPTRVDWDQLVEKGCG